MKRQISILIALLLGIVLLLGAFGCNAGTQAELQSKVDELQSQLEEMENRLAEMDEQLRERDERIAQLEDELGEKELVGTLYTLQEAYDDGWLTQEDLMSIAFYHHNGRLDNEEIMTEDYVPMPKTPEVLSEETELKIKRTVAAEYRDKYNVQEAKADGFTITEYCGTYGTCIAFMTRDIYSGGAAVIAYHTIADVTFYYGDGRRIQILRETK